MSDRVAVGIILALAAVFFVQAYFGSLSKSLTWDEPLYIASGSTFITRNDFRLTPETPPLMQELAALPTLRLRPTLPGEDDETWQSGNYVQFAKKYIQLNADRIPQITFWARRPFILLGMGLILAIGFWGRRLYGTGPALLAIVLWQRGEKGRGERGSLGAGSLVRGLAAVGVVSAIVVGAGYNFSFDYSLYVHGIKQVGSTGRPGYLYYLFGNISNEPWWYYNLPALAVWQREHPEARPLQLLYFGNAPPAAYGVEAEIMEQQDIMKPRPGTYAISAHQLVFFRKLGVQTGLDLDWLTRYRPIARAGQSIYIYQFP